MALLSYENNTIKPSDIFSSFFLMRFALISVTLCHKLYHISKYFPTIAYLERIMITFTIKRHKFNFS